MHLISAYLFRSKLKKKSEEKGRVYRILTPPNDQTYMAICTRGRPQKRGPYF